MNIFGLEAFLSAAQRGSFHLAAAHLNISPTALSHRMRKFEDELGVKLFTRTTRQVVLTQAGQELLPRAEKILYDMEMACDDLMRHSQARPDRLNMGCLPTIALHHLPMILARFQQKYQDMSIRIHDNAATELRDLVQAGAIEFAVTIVSVHSWDLDIEVSVKEPFLLVCNSAHPLAERDTVNWSEIEGEALVRISIRAGNRVLIDDALGPRANSFIWRYEVQHTATALGLVQAGLAMAVLPKTSINLNATPEIRLVPLRNPTITRTLGIITRKGMPLSPMGKELCDMISAHLRSY